MISDSQPTDRDDLIVTRSESVAATYCQRGTPALSVTLGGGDHRFDFACDAARALFGGRVAVERHDVELAREVERRGLDVARLP